MNAVDISCGISCYLQKQNCSKIIPEHLYKHAYKLIRHVQHCMRRHVKQGRHDNQSKIDLQLDIDKHNQHAATRHVMFMASVPDQAKGW